MGKGGVLLSVSDYVVNVEPYIAYLFMRSSRRDCGRSLKHALLFFFRERASRAGGDIRYRNHHSPKTWTRPGGMRMSPAGKSANFCGGERFLHKSQLVAISSSRRVGIYPAACHVRNRRAVHSGGGYRVAK